MKITLERSHLALALGVAGRAVSTRNTLPILSNVLLETQDNALKITATDLDTAIHSRIPAQVVEAGSVAVPASVLSDIVSKLSDAPITLEIQDGKVTVRSGKSNYTILSLPAEDFPVVPSLESDCVEIELESQVFSDMLRLTTFAASKEESRNILTGVLFEARGNHLTLVATDTHRLAWKQATLGEDVGNPVSAIVPARPLAELKRVLKDNVEASVHIRFGQSQVQFETPDVTLVSRVLDGQFPNYEKVIPRDVERTAIFDRVELLSALRRVFIVAKDNSEKGVFTAKHGFAEIKSQSQNVGLAYEEVRCDLTGEEIEIAFNIRYFMDFLNALSCQEVKLEMSGSLNPGALKQVGADNWLGIVMPMMA